MILLDERLATPGRLVWVAGDFGEPRRLAVILEGGGSAGNGRRWLDVAYVVDQDDLTIFRCLSDQQRFPDLALWEPIRKEVG